MSKKWTVQQLASFARRYPGITGIHSLAQSEETSVEDALRLLEKAVEQQLQGITYNSLPTKCRILRAALESFPEDKCVALARRMLGIIAMPGNPMRWERVQAQFTQLASQYMTESAVQVTQ